MSTTNDTEMTGLRKAGVLMVALGAEVSARVLKELSDAEVERVTAEIARMKDVDPDVLHLVAEEFRERLASQEFVEPAGLEYARQVLDQAVGAEKAQEIVNRLDRQRPYRPFETIRTADPARLAALLKGEHPQTVALVVSHLPAAGAAAVLSGLTAEVQHDVAHRVATMDAASPEMLQHVEQALLERMSGAGESDATPVGGASALVDILNQVDRTTERTILDGLTSVDPSLADAIREKMFAFEDIVNLDNRTIQTILREVEQEDLRLALKGASETVRESVFANISERAAETLKEDIELMGPTRLRDVEAAQKNIVFVIRRLEESGDIATRRSGEEDVLV